jgi:hypothetical protein
MMIADQPKRGRPKGSKNKPKPQQQHQAQAAEKPWTMPIEEAGRRYYGLGRSASYDAARTGLMPTIRFGRRVQALPRAIERQLEEVGQSQTQRAKRDADA